MMKQKKEQSVQPKEKRLICREWCSSRANYVTLLRAVDVNGGASSQARQTQIAAASCPTRDLLPETDGIIEATNMSHKVCNDT